MHADDQKLLYKNYRSLDFLNKPYQEKALFWARALKLEKPKTLELGAADGSFLDLMKQTLKGEAAGLDIAADKKGVVKSHDFSQKLPFPDNSFDLIISLEVIEHLYDTDFFLAEIKRVLKPKGFLILSTPNLASLPNRLKLLIGHYPKNLEYSRQGAGHIHLYTHQILKQQILAHHFNLLKLSSVNFPDPFITKISYPTPFRHFSFILGDRLPSIGSSLLLLAQK